MWWRRFKRRALDRKRNLVRKFHKVTRRFAKVIDAFGTFVMHVIHFMQAHILWMTAVFIMVLGAMQTSDIIDYYKERHKEQTKVRTYEYEYNECLLKKAEYQSIIHNLSVKYGLNQMDQH